MQRATNSELNLRLLCKIDYQTNGIFQIIPEDSSFSDCIKYIALPETNTNLMFRPKLYSPDLIAFGLITVSIVLVRELFPYPSEDRVQCAFVQTRLCIIHYSIREK